MITYAVKKVRNPKSPDADYCSNRAQKSGDYDFKELADDIAHATTCTKGDAMAVLMSIKPFIVKALLAGKSVHLDELGSFIISIHGKAFPQEVTTDKEFKPSDMIRGWKVVFRPDVELKKSIADNIRYQRISSECME
jgi:predicted histone-like DNA-binding protein